MGKRTIYISEDDMIADIIFRCPPAIRVIEKYFGKDFLRRDDLEKISLRVAITLFRHNLQPILIELNRICI
ncbi:MAG: hypothetical protein ACPL5I_11825 [Thermodesulfobacteriota bacterium]